MERCGGWKCSLAPWGCGLRDLRFADGDLCAVCDSGYDSGRDFDALYDRRLSNAGRLYLLLLLQHNSYAEADCRNSGGCGRLFSRPGFVSCAWPTWRSYVEGGTVFNFVAASVVGVAIWYAIGQAPPMVACLWGVFVWKEFGARTREQKVISLRCSLRSACAGADCARLCRVILSWR